MLNGCTFYLYAHSEFKELDNVVGYGEEDDERDEEPASDNLVNLPLQHTQNLNTNNYNNS
jgi:hypothetical protein